MQYFKFKIEISKKVMIYKNCVKPTVDFSSFSHCVICLFSMSDILRVSEQAVKSNTIVIDFRSDLYHWDYYDEMSLYGRSSLCTASVDGLLTL